MANLQVVKDTKNLLVSLALLSICLFVVPFWLGVSICFRIYRATTIYIIQMIAKKQVIPMNGQDAIWLQDTKENPTIINAVMTTTAPMDIAVFRKRLMVNLVKKKDKKKQLCYPKISHYPKQIWHRYVWLPEEKFNIEDHIIEMKVEEPISSQKELEKLVSSKYAEPMPEKQSPWQMIIVPIAYKSETWPKIINEDSQLHHRSAAIFRVHHAIGDGISIMRVIRQTMVDQIPETIVEPKRFGATDHVKRVLGTILHGPRIFLERLIWPADNNLFHGPKLTGKKHVAWSTPIPLYKIKAIKNKFNATINDVLVSCLSGSFRDYAQSIGDQVPKDMLAYIPVDLRGATSDNELGNYFSLVFMNLPIGEGDDMKRLLTTKQRMNEIKSSPEPLLNMWAMMYCMARLPNWFTQAVFDFVSQKCTLILSNVPGPPSELAVTRPIDMMIFWPPQRANVGIGVSILSYNGSVRMGFSTDEVIMDKPELITKSFVKHFFQLEKSLADTK